MTLQLQLLDVSVNFDANKIADQISSALGKTLGQIGPTVWEAAVRKVYINGWQLMTFSALFFMGAITLTVVFGWTFRNRQRGDGWGASAVFSALGVFIALFLAVAIFTSALQNLLNPQWGAIQDLLCSARNTCG